MDPHSSLKTTVGVLGYGRFGRALAELLLDAGYAVRAFDPFAEPPAEVRVETLEQLVAGIGVLFVAVPVAAFTSTLGQIAPLLDPGVLVLDVCSVKLGPSEAMAKLLPTSVPWAATHPLFGPSSLARGERPLRVVVCPNEHHPQAASQASQLFVAIGCEVLEQTADAHDQVMAQTHALAFFLAKGLLDIGAGTGAAFVPPSFQAIARTVEAVREDAGHLFVALHRDNPHARATRRQFLDALHNIDVHLVSAVPGAGPASDPVLQIPELSYQAPELLETRELIDAVDRELVQVLARRKQLVRRAGRVKAQRGWGVHDPGREQQLLAKRRAWAEDCGLTADDVEEVFGMLLSHSRLAQRKDS